MKGANGMPRALVAASLLWGFWLAISCDFFDFAAEIRNLPELYLFSHLVCWMCVRAGAVVSKMRLRALNFPRESQRL